MVSIAMAMLMAACSQENVESNQESQGLITFSVPEMQWNKANTRAQVLGSIEDLKASTTDIRVTAKYHDDHSKVYINNERLQYLDNTWTLSKYVDNAWIATKYYWLPNTSLDFFADVVSGNRSTFNSLLTNKTDYTFDYVVPDAIADQHDYIYAVSLNQSHDENGVPLEFKHALSQIVFMASVSENWNVSIKSITIHNIKNAGTFDYRTGLWTNSGTANHSMVFTLATPKVFEGHSGEERLQAVNDERLVLMPQELNNPWQIPDDPDPNVNHITTVAEPNLQSYVEIVCKIQSRISGTYYAGGATEWGTVYAPISGVLETGKTAKTWEPNKKYIYTLPFGAGYKATGEETIQYIGLSATVTDWEAGETAEGSALFD